MPRVYRTRKEYEGFLIREFLASAGYQIRRAKWTERPDAEVTISIGKQTKSVGIEHTDYFNDTLHGNASPLTSISCFWQDVQSSLVRRICHRRHLTGIDASVKLKEGCLNASSRASHIASAKQLAKELVAFVERHPVALGKTCQWRQIDFRGYPTLESAVTWLHVARYAEPFGYVSRCNWNCSNISCGGVSLSLDYVASAIKAKNLKAPNYRRNQTQELWLIISATGGLISNHAGPVQLSGTLAHPQLLSDCRSSVFDRIVFWERIHKWYRWLKPSESAVVY